MQLSNNYPGPSPDDYANVLALNTAFLNTASDLLGPQKGRLAAAPFLLFSMREDDPQWWQRALADTLQHDLVVTLKPLCTELISLQSAGISFLWQLARVNPYAARIIAGASVVLCDMLADLPLVTVLERTGARSDLVASRLGEQDKYGSQLLAKGASSQRKVRRAAHVVALQSLLTRSRGEQYLPLSAAACNMPRPRVRSASRSINR